MDNTLNLFSFKSYLLLEVYLYFIINKISITRNKIQFNCIKNKKNKNLWSQTAVMYVLNVPRHWVGCSNKCKCVEFEFNDTSFLMKKTILSGNSVQTTISKNISLFI